MDAYFLPDHAVNAWLDALARSYAVFAPVAEGGSVVFRPWITPSPDRGPARGPVWNRCAAESPRHALIPRAEPLLAYCRIQAEDGERIRLFEQPPPAPQAIVGLRTCDVRGVGILDRALAGSGTRDPLYAARRAATVLIALACTPENGPDAACFCHWFSAPDAESDGADAVMCPVADGYALIPRTQAGSDALRAASQDLALAPATPEQMRAVTDQTVAVRAALQARAPAPDMTILAARVRERFEDGDVWERLSAACLGCGACAHMCPACYCFTITDETQGRAGVRVRSWDSCLHAGYTQEASGHNPRAQRFRRYRNRVAHKFLFYPDLHAGAAACTGCGRCVRNCPAGVDLRAIVRTLLAQE